MKKGHDSASFVGDWGNASVRARSIAEGRCVTFLMDTGNSYGKARHILSATSKLITASSLWIGSFSSTDSTGKDVATALEADVGLLMVVLDDSCGDVRQTRRRCIGRALDLAKQKGVPVGLLIEANEVEGLIAPGFLDCIAQQLEVLITDLDSRSFKDFFGDEMPELVLGLGEDPATIAKVIHGLANR